MQAETKINDVIETKIVGSTFEIKLHSFTEDNMALYEDGMRKALKEKEAHPEKSLYFDFSECSNLPQLNEKIVFDVLQFMSFYCMRQTGVQVHWGTCLHDFLRHYGNMKGVQWKLSSTTLKKLLDANCGCLD